MASNYNGLCHEEIKSKLISAQEILDNINNKKSIKYDKITIKGDLDVSQLNLLRYTTRKVDIHVGFPKIIEFMSQVKKYYENIRHKVIIKSTQIPSNKIYVITIRNPEAKVHRRDYLRDVENSISKRKFLSGIANHCRYAIFDIY